MELALKALSRSWFLETGLVAFIHSFIHSLLEAMAMSSFLL